MKRLVTKCGKSRPNKTAKGMTETLSRKNHTHATIMNMKETTLTLSVKGTLDSLHGMVYYITTSVVQHPTDSTYSKRVYRLNERGKSRLKMKLRILEIRKQKENAKIQL